MGKAKLGLIATSIFLGVIALHLPSSGQNTELREPIGTSTPVQSVITPQSLPAPETIRKDKWTAYKMAKVIWLDKVAAANPEIIEAICSHPGAAKILAQHRHLDKIAEADHYLCRRLFRWRGSAQKLLRNKYCDKVIALDPQGIYADLKKHPQDAQLLIKSTVFNQMIDENPDLGKEISKHVY